MDRRLLRTTGQRLRALRDDFGWSQTQVKLEAEARGLRGMSQTRLSEAENGTDEEQGKVLGGEILRTLAILYGTSTDYLLCLTDDPTPPADRASGDKLLTPEADTVALMVDSLNNGRAIDGKFPENSTLKYLQIPLFLLDILCLYAILYSIEFDCITQKTLAQEREMPASEIRQLPAAMVDGYIAGEIATQRRKTEIYFENWEAAISGAGGFDGLTITEQEAE